MVETSQTGRRSTLIGFIPTKAFKCEHCKTWSESTSRSAKFCKATKCQAAKKRREALQRAERYYGGKEKRS